MIRKLFRVRTRSVRSLLNGLEGIMEKKEVLDILSEKQLHYIAARVSKPGSEIVSYDLKPACENGLGGFLGEHYRVTLSLKESNVVRDIHLFVKIVPRGNKPKAEFIDKNLFFKKEALVYELIDQIEDIDHLKPWGIKAVIYDDKVLVLPDLSVHGYKTHSAQKCFDRDHVFVIVASLARFHASFANYFTERDQVKPNFLKEYSFFNDEFFGDAPWLTGAAKVTNIVLKEFSSKAKHYPSDLEVKLAQFYLQGYASLDNNDGTLNVITHKDLWSNNILFQYKNEVPINAVLVDFQLARYAPPAFDLMSLLYMTTSRTIRDLYEREIFQHYYAVFSENLDDATKKRLLNLNYDFEGFLKWCEKARMYGLVQANSTLPCVCMDPEVGQATFDDPDTYEDNLTGDRSDPLVNHAKENVQYRLRVLEISEEFVEKFVLGK